MVASLPATYTLLPTTYCLLPTTYYLLPTTYYLLLLLLLLLLRLTNLPVGELLLREGLTHYTPLTAHHSLLTTHHLLLATDCVYVYRHVKLVVERSADPTISFVRGTFDRQAAASPSATTGGQLPDASETRRDLNSLNSSLNTGGSKEGGVIIKLDQVSE